MGGNGRPADLGPPASQLESPARVPKLLLSWGPPTESEGVLQGTVRLMGVRWCHVVKNPHRKARPSLTASAGEPGSRGGVPRHFKKRTFCPCRLTSHAALSGREALTTSDRPASKGLSKQRDHGWALEPRGRACKELLRCISLLHWRFRSEMPPSAIRDTALRPRVTLPVRPDLGPRAWASAQAPPPLAQNTTHPNKRPHW